MFANWAPIMREETYRYKYSLTGLWDTFDGIGSTKGREFCWQSTCLEKF